MKKITLLCLLFVAFFSSNSLFAQKNQTLTRCLTDEYNSRLLENNPNMMGSASFEAMVADYLSVNGDANRGGIIEIPLVIHVLHNGEALGEGPNITDAQVLSQVTVLNEDFGNMMGTPGESTEGGVDVEVRFVLAQQTPSGCPTNGINRVNICQDGTDRDDVQFWKTQTIWNRNLYMNMWSSKYVGDLTNILGYAQFPGGTANTDGVSAGHTYFGSSDYDDGTFSVSPPYDKGRTMTHEVGHFLGLFHTFQGGCAAPGDGVDDTPAVAAPNYGCNTGNVSCGSVDMVENYMDYSDDTCMNTYTAGQRTRVQAVMGGPRASLATSNGATPPTPVTEDPAIAILSVGVSCGTAINPSVRLTNQGTSTLTSATITYDIDGGASSNYNWSGSLASGESETVILPTQTAANGNHDLNVTVDSGGNARACNDADSSCFTLDGIAGPCASVGDDTDGFFTSTTGVTFNTISNLNNNPGHPDDDDVAYSDFTGISTDVNRESSYDLTVFVNTDGNFFVRTLVWIDWNQDCNFDATEEYDLGESRNLDHGESIGSPLSITIPNEAFLGNTVMRVITKWAGNAGGIVPTACESGHDGETEDYTINVLTSLSVDEFSTKSISIYPNPTSNVLNISLSNNDLPDGYEVYNMLGQSLTQKRVNSVSDLSVNTSNLSNGMYFIKITKAGNTVSLPFIKK